MELIKAQELIIEIKQEQKKSGMKYTQILDVMEKNGTPISMTTLRRVFASGSEMNAGSFSYTHTLVPIAAALKLDKTAEEPCRPSVEELDALKAIVRLQNEEIARLHDLKEHLENRVDFLVKQIALKDKRMDEKDEIIRRYMDKVL